MPVMVFYKEKSIPTAAAQEIINVLADTTAALLDAKIEVRVVEPVLAFNANEVHIEMRFRDFKDEWSDDQISRYHKKVMQEIGNALASHSVHCSYSFYILPSTPPRSMWDQGKS